MRLKKKFGIHIFLFNAEISLKKKAQKNPLKSVGLSVKAEVSEPIFIY
jgi:hypothetical protein